MTCVFALVSYPDPNLVTMIIAYSMTSRTAGLGRKSIEVAGMSPGPIKIENMRDVTLIARMFKPHLRSILLRKEWMVTQGRP